jgi:hypothetical protein
VFFPVFFIVVVIINFKAAAVDIAFFSSETEIRTPETIRRLRLRRFFSTRQLLLNVFRELRAFALLFLLSSESSFTSSASAQRGRRFWHF